ncbi:hypothetical protein ACLOJK_026261 [Asimina triloba]
MAIWLVGRTTPSDWLDRIFRLAYIGVHISQHLRNGPPFNSQTYKLFRRNRPFMVEDEAHQLPCLFSPFSSALLASFRLTHLEMYPGLVSDGGKPVILFLFTVRGGCVAIFSKAFFAFSLNKTFVYPLKEPGVVEAEFAKVDTNTLLRRFLTSRRPDPPIIPKGGFGVTPAEPIPLPSWLTEEDMEYFASKFDKSGFHGGLNYYRNLNRYARYSISFNWLLTCYFILVLVGMLASFMEMHQNQCVEGYQISERKNFESLNPLLGNRNSKKISHLYPTALHLSSATHALFMCRNWELMAPWTGVQVKVPVKFVVGDLDLTYTTFGAKEYIHDGGFHKHVPFLQDVVVMEGVAHFINQEKADEITEHIYSFIQEM